VLIGDSGSTTLRKRKHNPKRRLSDPLKKEILQSLMTKVSYVGSPLHKKHPGDFGLTPPAQPRLNKTLCDVTKIKEVREAMALLRAGISLGLVSRQQRRGLPQNIWAVSAEGIVVEAALDNEVTGTYHGYPLAPGDPLIDEILARWKQGAAHE
jgi:hypothetical protein